MRVLSVCTRFDAQLGYVSVPDVVDSASLSPAQLDVPQIAALLSSISRNNAYEGRDPLYIPDNLASGFVADLLGIGVQNLSDTLLALQRRGLIRPEGRCLRIIDRDALDELAEASDCARRGGAGTTTAATAECSDCQIFPDL